MNSVNLQDTRLIYRNLMFFYMIVVKYQKVKKKIPFKNTSKRITCPRNKLNQGNESLYSENYKTLRKETKDDIKK